MSNLPQQIKDRIANEAKDYAEHVPDCWPQIPYRSAATTWAERGQKLADALEAITGKTMPVPNKVDMIEIASKALAEWNQSIIKEEQA